MDFDLTKEQEMIRKEVRKFAQSEIAPVAADLDEKEAFSVELTRKMGDIGLFGVGINSLDLLAVPFDHTAKPLYAWITLLAMEVWHWTPLVALLAYAGLRAIPEAYYQAAKIDGASAWATFLYIQLPKMRGVLTIAVLLRWMDSFLIYAEPFALTGGGPGNTTTFLSIYLVKLATMQFDLGPAAAFSLIYFLIVLLFSFAFYQALLNVGRGEKG